MEKFPVRVLREWMRALCGTGADAVGAVEANVLAIEFGDGQRRWREGGGFCRFGERVGSCGKKWLRSGLGVGTGFLRGGFAGSGDGSGDFGDSAEEDCATGAGEDCGALVGGSAGAGSFAGSAAGGVAALGSDVTCGVGGAGVARCAVAAGLGGAAGAGSGLCRRE
jgi:hypothetical protein